MKKNKFINIPFITAIVAIIALYIVSRFYNLAGIPIFTDEAIYIRWAQIALHDPNFRFISLTDGKQPSFIWIVMVLMKFISDPLVAGRVASIISGFFGMVGAGVLGWYVFKDKKVGLWASFLYCILPFFVLYDRLALYDSLTAALYTWALVLSFLLVRTLRLDVSLILGMVIGAGMLTKSSALNSIALLPFFLIFLYSWPLNIKKILKFSGLSVLSSGMGFIMYSTLRVSPWFYLIGRKNEEFVYSFSDWIRHPFQFVLGNARGLSGWLVAYMTVPLLLIAIVAIFYKKEYLKERLVLAASFFVPFAILSFLGKVLFPRYLLFMSIPLLILIAWMFAIINSKVKNLYLRLTIIFICLIYPLYITTTLLLSPVQAPIPQTDRYQLLDAWPSGYGVKEVVAFAQDKSKETPIFIATEGTFGLFPAALEIYLNENKRAETKGYWPLNDDVVYKELVPKASMIPTYIVFKEENDIPTNWPIKKILEYRRGKGDTYLRLYQVLPQ